MTNEQARAWIAILEIAVVGVQEAITSEAGYATCGECNRLTKVKEALCRALEQNSRSNRPF